MKRSFIIGVTLALCFYGAELFWRRHYGDGFLTLVDHLETYRRRPYLSLERSWGSGIPFMLYTNSLGWRDASPRTITKITSHRHRILVLGDSFVEGIGWNHTDTIPGTMERLLQNQGYDAEVLNAGMSSFAPLPEYMRLKRFLDNGYRVDTVVILPDISDVPDELWYNHGYVFERNEPVQRSGTSFQPGIRTLLNHSTIARSCVDNPFLHKVWERVKQLKRVQRQPVSPDTQTAVVSSANLESTLGEETPKVLSTYDLSLLPVGEQTILRGTWIYHPPSLQGWAQEGLTLLETDLGRITLLCHQHGIRLIVVTYPWPQHLYTKEDRRYYAILKSYFPDLYAARERIVAEAPRPWHSAFQEEIGQFALTHGITYVDLGTVFATTANWHECFMPNDPHFNPQGVQRVAEQLVPFIMQETS